MAIGDVGQTFSDKGSTDDGVVKGVGAHCDVRLVCHVGELTLVPYGNDSEFGSRRND